MFKSCSYCGKIHDRKYVCPNKPLRKKEPTQKDRFRWSRKWNNKRKEINERDNFLCQVCVRKLFNTTQQYTYSNIEVHHIIPLEEDYRRRLDNENLICLCVTHHKEAERNLIPREKLLEIALEQEGKRNGTPGVF